MPFFAQRTSASGSYERAGMRLIGSAAQQIEKEVAAELSKLEGFRVWSEPDPKKAKAAAGAPAAEASTEASA